MPCAKGYKKKAVSKNIGKLIKKKPDAEKSARKIAKQAKKRKTK